MSSYTPDSSGGPTPRNLDFPSDYDDPNRHASLCDCSICDPLPDEDEDQ